MKTIYGPLDEMKGIEESFKAFYPKNIWLEEKISGVTEIVVLNQQQVNTIIEKMSLLSDRYYKKREREKAELND